MQFSNKNPVEETTSTVQTASWMTFGNLDFLGKDVQH